MIQNSIARLLPVLGLLGICSAKTCLAAEKASPVSGYPDEIEVVRYPVEADKSEQPALFWKPKKIERPLPLLVALHTWSNDYRQAGGEVQYANWCLQNDWVFIHPNFRGPNRTPEAMGSDLAIADIRAAVEWAKSQASIDESRIYAIGVSGGGHITQLLAGRTPDIWAGISSWCGISDIAAWHEETTASGRGKYAKDIEGALGGSPKSDPKLSKEALHQSPISWLEAASGVPLDLNHGIDDGRSGSVPFTHSLHAWNAVVPEAERFSPDWIAEYYEKQSPPTKQGEIEGALYGKRKPLFRKVSGNTRITIFDGGHEVIHLAALNWLAAQQKGKPVNWDPPKHADLKTSDLDSESGK